MFMIINDCYCCFIIYSSIMYVTVSAFIHRNSIIGIAIIVERKITNRYLVYDVCEFTAVLHCLLCIFEVLF